MSLPHDQTFTAEDFRALVEGSPDPIAVLTPEGRLRYASPSLAGTLGYSSEELDGSDAMALVHPDDVPRVRSAIAGATDGQGASEQIVRVRQRDGSWCTFEAIATRFGGGSRSVDTVLYSRDVTKRRTHDAPQGSRAAESLTGLPGRPALIDRLERSIARAQKGPDYEFAVLYLDLDRFKLVNDSLGQVIGDMLLAAVARRLSTCIRPGDLVAHLGADEFALFLDHIRGVDDVTAVAERIRDSLIQPLNLDGQEVFASTSIGIALSSTGYERPDDVLRDADTAMHRAKTGGSGRYELFDRAMHARVLARLRLENDLRRAIDRREFVLHYQPIVHLPTGRITAFEALVRWRHPERGLVYPADFIPAAEETGLIDAVCAFVIREACAQARVWQDRFRRNPPLAISMNFSSTDFTQSDVMTNVADALTRTGLEGRHVTIEITESILMRDIDSVISVLLALKSLDIESHIDDFGTGYSSLSYLYRLPTDAIKIDRSFVGRLDSDGDAYVMVRAIIDLAHNLGRRVIAEGIETDAQLERLQSLQCEYGQGYYFSRPMDAGGAEALLASGKQW